MFDRRFNLQLIYMASIFDYRKCQLFHFFVDFPNFMNEEIYESRVIDKMAKIILFFVRFIEFLLSFLFKVAHFGYLFCKKK